MPDIKKIFYNIFWQNKACQNLFLLSKEELLDTKTMTYGEERARISLPRIILSNVHKSDQSAVETIKYRSETHGIVSEALLHEKIDIYGPIISDFIESRFGKALAKVTEDLTAEGKIFFEKVIPELLDDDGINFERALIKFLQEYGFVGPHINSFRDIEKFFEKEAIEKNLKGIMSEANFRNFLIILKSAKDMYVNGCYKSLYESNQVLIGALHDQEDYQSRLGLFNILFDCGIISTSKEDSFVECVNCAQGTYRAVVELRVTPKKLEKLRCPNCDSQLSFYVPYDLHPEIFEIVKSHDGLLLDALVDLLDKEDITCETGSKYLSDIEIDCNFKKGNGLFIVECKMYKLFTSPDRLKKKIREHFGKLLNDVIRIHAEAADIHPILLVNLNDTAFLEEVEKELKMVSVHPLTERARICNINNILEHVHAKI